MGLFSHSGIFWHIFNAGRAYFIDWHLATLQSAEQEGTAALALQKRQTKVCLKQKTAQTDRIGANGAHQGERSTSGQTKCLERVKSGYRFEHSESARTLPMESIRANASNKAHRRNCFKRSASGRTL